MQVEVLRLSHRIRRDPRLSTHVALTARAFLASKLYYSGNKDSSLEATINKVTQQFGGNFEIEYINDPINLIKEKKKENFLIVHLTCYGLPIQDKIREIRKYKRVLLIVGGSKVAPEIFELADINLSVTSQPHSEVASICLFLDYYFKRKELTKTFNGAKIKIIPQKIGKNVKKVS